MGKQNREEGLIAAGVLVSLSYLATLFIEAPFPIEPAWKASGILLLAAYAFLRGAPITGAGLLASAAGDVALALRPPVFVAGMALFGLAHLFYIAAFITRIRRGGLNTRYLWAGLAIALISALLAQWFLPDMGPLLAPGLAYQTIITVMVMSALLSPAPRMARFGALLFMLSDTLIALGLYKNIAAPPGSIWLTYAAAQAMIAFALAEREEETAGVVSRNAAAPQN